MVFARSTHCSKDHSAGRGALSSKQRRLYYYRSNCWRFYYQLLALVLPLQVFLLANNDRLADPLAAHTNRRRCMILLGKCFVFLESQSRRRDPKWPFSYQLGLSVVPVTKQSSTPCQLLPNTGSPRAKRGTTHFPTSCTDTM